MYQGFYNLTSGMISQQRNLNTVSNNMVNSQTAGYKADTNISSTFEEEMLLRTGRRNKDNPEELGITSKIRRAQETKTDFSQGAFKDTGGKYDFAISGEGWFSVLTPSGVRYTRNGSFSVDPEGTLELSGIGKVLDNNGQTISIKDENFTVTKKGIIEGENGSYGTIGIYSFQDDAEALKKEDNGMYSANTQPEISNEAEIYQGMLEDANTNLVQEMTSMISSQRAYQSAAQMLKMYDQMMSKASDIGRIS